MTASPLTGIRTRSPLEPASETVKIEEMGDIPAVTLESVLSQARRLSASDKVRLLEAILPEIETAVEGNSANALRNCYGLFSDLGPAPSSGDIDEIRNEMLQGFPRADAA